MIKKHIDRGMDYLVSEFLGYKPECTEEIEKMIEKIESIKEMQKMNEKELIIDKEFNLFGRKISEYNLPRIDSDKGKYLFDFLSIYRSYFLYKMGRFEESEKQLIDVEKNEITLENETLEVKNKPWWMIKMISMLNIFAIKINKSTTKKELEGIVLKFLKTINKINQKRDKINLENQKSLDLLTLNSLFNVSLAYFNLQNWKEAFTNLKSIVDFIFLNYNQKKNEKKRKRDKNEEKIETDENFQLVLVSQINQIFSNSFFDKKSEKILKILFKSSILISVCWINMSQSSKPKHLLDLLLSNEISKKFMRKNKFSSSLYYYSSIVRIYERNFHSAIKFLFNNISEDQKNFLDQRIFLYGKKK